MEQKSDDFFPYASGNHSYWTGTWCTLTCLTYDLAYSYDTGYFTSHPNLKGLIRRSSALLQLTRQMNAVGAPGRVDNGIEVHERAQSLAQHHDAVTGTAKWPIAENYANRIFTGWDESERLIAEAFNTVVPIRTAAGKGVPPKQLFCRRMNESVCDALKSGGGSIAVTVYNGNSHVVDSLVRLPLYTQDGRSQNIHARKVMDSHGRSIKSQIYKSFVPAHRYLNNDTAPYELAFMATKLPALGFKTYFLTNDTGEKVEGRKREAKRAKPKITAISSDSPASISNSVSH